MKKMVPPFSSRTRPFVCVASVLQKVTCTFFTALAMNDEVDPKNGRACVLSMDNKRGLKNYKAAVLK